MAPTAVADGMTHLIRFHTANGASATLNVNGLGAKPLYCYAGSWVQAPLGMLATDQIARVAYNASAGAYFLLDLTYSSIQTLSAQGSVSFISLPTTVNRLALEFDLLMSSNGANLLMQFYNSAGTLDAGGSSYFYVLNEATTTPSTGAGGITASSILLGAGVANAAGIGVDGDLIINNIQGAKATQCNWRSHWLDSSSSFYANYNGGAGRLANGNITGVKLFPSAGTFSGLVTLRASVN